MEGQKDVRDMVNENGIVIGTNAFNDKVFDAFGKKGKPYSIITRNHNSQLKEIKLNYCFENSIQLVILFIAKRYLK
jgi:hypothetical protein